MFKNEKLIADLHPRKKYVIHFEELKLYLQCGAVLDNVHRVLSFKQKPWLETFIAWCTENRKKSTTDFEKDFWKLIVNSLYGKSIQQMRKRTNIQIVRSPTQLINFVKKATFSNYIHVTDTIGLVVMKRTTCRLNKPIYTGATCVSRAKTIMTDFHYNHISKHFKNVKLLMTDTNSMAYYITGQDPYVHMLNNKSMFDTSNFPKVHNNTFLQQLNLFDKTNNKVLGKFKDECPVAPIYKFVFLKPKMYAYKKCEGKEKDSVVKRAKGIPTDYVKKQQTFATYQSAFDNIECKDITAKCIRSKNHQNVTIEITKAGLNQFCSKRYNISKNESLPFGHYKVKNYVKK